MSRTRPVLLACLVLAGPSLLAQQGSYKGELRQFSRFAYGGPIGNGSSYSYTSGSGDNQSTLNVSTDPKAEVTGLGPGPFGPQSMVLFAKPITVSASGSFSWTAPPSDDPNKEFTATYQVKIQDGYTHGGFPGCSGNVDTKSVKANSKATFSSSVGSCQVRTLTSFNQTADGSEAEVEILGSFSGGGAPGADIVWATYDILKAWDDLSLFPTTPPSGTTIVPAGVNQDFAGTAFITLGSRPDAELKLSVVDASQAPLKTLSPINVRRGGGSKTYSLPQVPMPAEGSNLSLQGVLSAPGGAVLASASIPFRAERCLLTGLLRRSAGARDYWLPDVPVSLLEGENVLGTVQATGSGSLERPKVEYCFTPADLPANTSLAGKQLRLKATLQDSLPSATPTLQVSDSYHKRVKTPLELQWNAFTLGPQSNRKDLNVDVSAGLAVPADSVVADVQTSAEVYWHVWRMVHGVVPRASLPPLKRALPIKIGLQNSNSQESYYCADEAPPRCRAETSVGLSVVDSAPGAAPDALWHELGHHLLAEIYEARAIDAPGSANVDINHNGYANDFTTDSLEEGFASFWSAVTNRTLANDARTVLGPYRLASENGSVPITLETNYQASNPKRPEYSYGVPAHEELAIAGLLWDLLDTQADAENRYGVPLTDAVGLGLTNVMRLVKTKPQSVRGLYQAALISFPFLTDSTSGLSSLDQVFLLHGFFHDKQGDGQYHVGDEVGRAANGGPWQGYTLNETEYKPVTLLPRLTRQSTKPTPGSKVAIALKGPDGSAIAASQVQVSIEYGPGFESLDTRETLLVKDGNVYVQLPPPEYGARAVFTVPGSPEPALVLDSATYWRSVPAADHFAEHTFEVPDDVPQVDSVYPASAAAGARVTLAGRNFAPTAADDAVFFGSQRATVVFATPTSLLVSVPALLPGGIVPVTVSRAGKASGALEFEVLAPEFSVSAASLDFGPVGVGGTAQKTLKVKNAGLAPLTLTVAVSGPFSAVPSGTRVAPITVPPGGEQTLTVGFAPRTAGLAAGSLVLSGNDVVSRAAAIALSGTGGAATGADIATSPAALDFGSVALGQNRSATLTLRNSGAAPLTISAATFGASAFTLTSAALPLTLAPGTEQALALRFAPSAAVPYSDAMALASNDPDEPRRVVPLSGAGAAAGTSPASCTFGVTPGVLAAGASRSSGVVTITAPAGCAWTARSADAFVSLGSAGGSGNGNVSYTIESNDSGRLRAGRLTLAGAGVVVTQEADAASATVPIVLTSGGVNGSFFTSELTLTNRGTADALAELSYTAAFGGGSGTASDIVPAGAQLIFPDALEYLRSLGIPIPATGNRGGTLRVRGAASATVRTASVVPEGRAGLAYGAVARRNALTGTSYLCGLRQNENDRANVAVINAGKSGDGDVVLRLTVFSGDPAQPASAVLPDVGLPPGGFAQFSGILGLNGLSLANGWVKVERVGGTAPYFAYAVINDQANSDGSFVPPVSAESLAGKSGITLPVVVEVSTFSTELVVTNFGAAAKSFQVSLVADAVQTAGNTAGVAFTLAPGEQRILPEFVQVLRDRGAAGVGPKGTTYAGAAFLTVSSGDVSGLFLGARTSSPGGGGRYGLFYTGVPYGAAATSAVYLYGLQQNPDNRANVAFVNTGEADDSTDTLRVDLYDGATASLVRTFEVTLAPRRWAQVSGVLTQYAPNVTNAYAKVTRTAGTNPFIAYAVVNDGGAPGQRSGDGAFVVMEPQE